MLRIKLIFNKLKSKFILDKNENFFVKFNKFKKLNYKKKKVNKIVIQMVKDYYYLIHLDFLIKEKKIDPNSIVAIWPYNIYFSNKNKSLLVNFLNFKFFEFLEYRKWYKLYKSIGINKFENLEINNPLVFIRTYFKVFSKVKSLKKSEIYNYKYDNIKVGDLIAETYIRFSYKVDVNQKDFFLKYIFSKSLIAIDKLNLLFSKYKFKKHFFSYISYVQNGLPARYSLKENLECITLYSNTGYTKKISKSSCTHIENISKFINKFKKNKNKNKLLKISNKLLEEKFKGTNNHAMPYLKKNAYINSNQSNDLIKYQKFDGVLFLHDFYDSITIYNPKVFSSYYEWTIFTLNLIKKNNLNIAIKPHPNALLDNDYQLKKIIKEFDSLIWLNKNISNSILFSKIKFGISLHGSVLYEMPFFDVVPISAGADHHSKDYNLVFTAKSKKDYTNLILNATNLKLIKNYKKKLQEFFYIFSLQNNDYIESLSRNYNLRQFMFKGSSCLKQYLQMIYEKNTHTL